MPANPHKGEVSFELVSGETFTLQFSVDAVCTVEAMLDKSSVEICNLVLRRRVGALRAAFWAGLQAYHPKITLREAGDMIPQINADNWEVILKLIVRAMNLAFGEADESGEAADDGKADPPEGGTGPVSSEPGAA